MPYYIITITIIYCLGLFEISSGFKKVSKIITPVIAIILIILAGLKTGGVTDILEYKEWYEKYYAFDLNSSFEPGYQLFISISKQLGFDFSLFYLLIAVISISIKSKVFYKLTPYVGAAFLIYFTGCFFERDNDGIRQGLSISFCFLGLYYLNKDCTLKFLVSSIIATTIHYTSIIFFIALLLAKFRSKDKIIIIVICAALICSIANIFITSYLIPMIPFMVSLNKLEIYSSNQYSEGLGISIGILFRIAILFMFILVKNRIRITETLYYLLRNGLAFSIVCSLLFGDFVIIAHRLPYVFREFQIFIFPYILSAVPSRGGKCIALSIIYLYSITILYRFFENDSIYDTYSNILLP